MVESPCTHLQTISEQMHSNHYYDFADMILEVITQLEQNETLRINIQERFNYILIDEFQILTMPNLD